MAVQQQRADQTPQGDLVGASAPRLAARRLSAGLYSPEYTPSTAARTTLILAHADRMQPKVADVMLGDDRLIEVNEKGDIVWEWLAGDYIDEMGFAPDARAVIKAAAAFNKARGSFDWLHVNSATYVGPNQWYDKGDRRFAPDNVIISSREPASSRSSLGRGDSRGGCVRLGASPQLRAIRQIIGKHHPHLIRRDCAQASLSSTTADRAVRLRGHPRRRTGSLSPLEPRARDQSGDAQLSGPTRNAVIQHENQQRATAAERQPEIPPAPRPDVRGHAEGAIVGIMFPTSAAPTGERGLAPIACVRWIHSCGPEQRRVRRRHWAIQGPWLTRENGSTCI